MRPEDIDKLFKERLLNTSPTPPADLWNRLQDRMQAAAEPQEEEETKVVPLLRIKEKSTFTWLYSSVAAAVSLVLSVGVVFYNINTGTPEVSEALADKKQTLELNEKPVYTQPVPETVAQAEPMTENTSEENNFTPQATDATPAASNSTEAVEKPGAIAKAMPKVVQQPKRSKAVASKQPKANVQQAGATNSTSESAADEAEAIKETAMKPANSVAIAKAAANLNAEPVQIIIQRSVSSTPAMAEAAEAPSGLNKKAKLAKNIFKQVRNLASGENVELSEVGINADKVALNTQIGKQKFSKVINL